MDLGLKRPGTLLFTVTDKVFMVMGDLEIGLRPSTLPPIIPVDVVCCRIYLLIFIMLKTLFMVMKAVIVVVMMEYVDLGVNTPTTLPFKKCG